MTQILVIDDDPSIRENVAEILGYEGYQVLQGEHGAMGLKLAREHVPDLIICDIMMPDMDGLEVLEELQIDPVTATIPFIFQTAKSDRASLRQGMEFGAADYLTKPYSSDELVLAVQSQLKRSSLLKQRAEQSIEDLRGNLIFMLPHELRTPLFGILGYAELLQLEYETLEKDDVRHMGEHIARSGYRLLRVFENYLLYAQTEILRNDPRFEESLIMQTMEAPGAMIQDVVAQKADQFQRKDDVSVRAEDTLVRISAERLKKIVEELVDNAFKFSKPGTPIEITAETSNDVYMLKVVDHGRGMTSDQISRIGAYMQFGRKLREQQGLGLGLILAKRFAELHGGKLTITSDSGRSTTVCVELLV